MEPRTGSKMWVQWEGLTGFVLPPAAPQSSVSSVSAVAGAGSSVEAVATQVAQQPQQLVESTATGSALVTVSLARSRAEGATGSWETYVWDGDGGPGDPWFWVVGENIIFYSFSLSPITWRAASVWNETRQWREILIGTGWLAPQTWPTV